MIHIVIDKTAELIMLSRLMHETSAEQWSDLHIGDSDFTVSFTFSENEEERNAEEKMLHVSGLSYNG